MGKKKVEQKRLTRPFLINDIFPPHTLLMHFYACGRKEQKKRKKRAKRFGSKTACCFPFLSKPTKKEKEKKEIYT